MTTHTVEVGFGGFWQWFLEVFGGGIQWGWRWFSRLFVGLKVIMKEKRDGVGFVKESSVFVLFHVVFFGDIKIMLETIKLIFYSMIR